MRSRPTKIARTGSSCFHVFMFQKRQINHGCLAYLALGWDLDGGTGVEMWAFEDGQGEGGIGENGRDGGAGDAADFVAGVVGDLGAGDGQRVSVETNARDLAGDLLAGVHAGDDFLAGV